MAELVVMPKLGLTMAEGVIDQWLKCVGERVEAGEPLLVVQSDKANVDCEAHAGGVLRRILLEPGITVPVGTVIGVIAEPDEDISSLDIAGAAAPVLPQTDPAPTAPTASPTAVAPSSPCKLYATPLARRLAKEHGIDPASLKGSGPSGLVRRADVLAAVKQRTAVPALRRLTAEAVSRSKATIPHFYASLEVDMAQLLLLRQALREQHDKLTLTAVIGGLVAAVLKRHKAVNAGRDEVDLGIAVGTDDGVLVPVICGADRFRIPELALRIAALAERGRAGRLAPDELTGGSFTLSNLGMFGLDSFVAIIRPTESGILAVGRMRERPAVVNGQVVARPTSWLTLSADHRTIDGMQAAAFLADLERELANPHRAL